jgi:hypothetical protein
VEGERQPRPLALGDLALEHLGGPREGDEVARAVVGGPDPDGVGEGKHDENEDPEQAREQVALGVGPSRRVDEDGDRRRPQEQGSHHELTGHVDPVGEEQNQQRGDRRADHPESTTAASFHRVVSLMLTMPVAWR